MSAPVTKLVSRCEPELGMLGPSATRGRGCLLPVPVCVCVCVFACTSSVRVYQHPPHHMERSPLLRVSSQVSHIFAVRITERVGAPVTVAIVKKHVCPQPVLCRTLKQQPDGTIRGCSFRLQLKSYTASDCYVCTASPSSSAWDRILYHRYIQLARRSEGEQL